MQGVYTLVYRYVHQLSLSVQCEPRWLCSTAGGFSGDYFTGENFRGGGGISPPSGIPRLQLPHTHPNMQANATFRVINIWKSPREAALVPLMWCNDVVQFLQQLGYPQYAVPLASSGFAGMQEPCLINSSGLQECGILDGHALRILLHQHSQVRSLHTSCAIARNGWLVDIERRGAPALHCRHP